MAAALTPEPSYGLALGAAFTDTLLESHPEGVVLVDADGRILQANRRAGTLLGSEPAQLRGCELETVLGTVDVARNEEGEVTRSLEVTGHALHGAGGRVMCLREEQVSELDAASTLMLGVAHEFGNLLTTLTATAEYLDEAADDPEERADCLGDIRAAGAKGRALVAELQRIARPHMAPPVHGTVLAPVLDDLIRGLADISAPGVRIEAEVQSDLPPAWARRDALYRLLFEVASSAIEGPRSRPETLRIVARPGAGEGGLPTVVVDIIDDGMALSEEDRASAFEPFFSTKRLGRGTGVGLYGCQRTARAMGARLEVGIDDGDRTVVSLVVPAAPGGRVPD